MHLSIWSVIFGTHKQLQINFFGYALFLIISGLFPDGLATIFQRFRREKQHKFYRLNLLHSFLF